MTFTTPLKRLAKLALSTLLLMLVGVGLLTARPGTAMAAEVSPPVDSAALSKAVVAMEQLDQMRISLASTLEGRTEEPTIKTMKEVCKPVGMRAVAIGKENGWQVRQVASKYRNPDHAPANAQEREVIDLFSRHPEINGLWEPAVAEQGAGLNYYRRINVEPSCLACHGTKASRPAFIKDNYPDDKAFDLAVGELRGMYAVHLPEVQAALAAAS
ncbi:DUF3365 domain-containing protein [Synechococcus sp. Cruz-9H2]|uniref:Tll0287-like domain-containing protein n=1 Tax=unclassified Synechococcus TaxID=2626047 RepID=UPI0020CC618F|nr:MULTISPECIES: DUF3365 domain-containing protein [unclassified Synechococcus]MCP9821044.1 DUF3365 domain-containing protein [Synechococcus sp. Cruz-9H2]MCP9845280.1 DUF3365 domain-containing protein [Synechococcus sp. Edmonson 11F2]MCP9857437.1 DUF3365 domain-containing protein [Synechococcus sp. Cruz-9C9]MCP9864688.1 DUF3365 domain-containing protein [Synechococcus sp. Cruz-7E5]MCP9871957.1 DUF3365 domain-containing protein [Synechococcus sp. Cruz-7B9]